LEPFSQTWPKSGSMRNGSVFQRQRLELATAAGVSSSSDGLLPTPLVTNRAGMRPSPATIEGKRGEDLGPAIGSLLPTPRASARENRQTKRTPSQEAGTHGLCLAAEVLELLPGEKGSAATQGRDRAGRPRKTGDANLPEALLLLPTPRAADGNGNGRAASGREGSPSLMDCLLPTPRATDGTKWGPGQTSTGGPSLPSSVLDLLPTPSSADGAGGHRSRSGNRSAELLLPGLARELSAATRQPSDGTNAPSDG
jgi:hypothetical protein